MSQLRLSLQTQTPLTRLLRPVPPGTRLETLREGADHLPSPGGVTRMLRGLASRMEQSGGPRVPAWVSLSTEPASITWERRRLELVALEPRARARYAQAKNELWNEIHGLGSRPLDVASVSAGLRELARAIGGRCTQLHDERAFDLFYTHDFQLLELARELPADVPRVFRWHVPVRPLPPATREYVARALDEYDAIVVSTEAYAEELRRWGVNVPVHASYPYLDESRGRVVTAADIEAFDASYGLADDDIVFTMVARMDPMKSHDVAIRALARIADQVPQAKLVLVGGGGFSGGRQGLGLTQAGEWRARLGDLAESLGLTDRIVFTGGIRDEDLDVALTRSRAVLLPSVLEGFGLAAVEGWLYGKPVVVSRGCGVAELVEEGVNGFTFDADDDATLAERMLVLAKDDDLAQRMGAEGRATARVCHLDRGVRSIWETLRSVLEPEDASAASKRGR